MRSKALVVAPLLVALFTPSGQAAPGDPAARGLALFVHAPGEAPAGSTLPVQVRVFRFPAVATLLPAAGATVEATWDPESLGDTVAKVPPPVTVTCDGAGRAHRDVAVPPGRGELKLLVAARFTGHERTRSIDVKRSARYEIDLRASDTRVVPGGTVSAWVLLRDRVTGRPAGGKLVDLALKEGSLARFARRLTTDRAGTASALVRVPMVGEPEWTWTLSARTALGGGDEAEAATTLSIREETPQAPVLKARWDKDAVPPGTRATFTLEVRDGAGQGVAKLPLRYWVGQKGIAAPKDDKAWQKSSTEIHTDADGNAKVTVDTPRTISPRGSSMTVLAKALVEGHPLSASSTMSLAMPAPEVQISPEFGVLVPGLPQRLFFRSTLDGKPVAAEFAVSGHGLRGNVRTNARGFGELAWRLPAEVGARVPEGASTDCAGEVAATVHVRWIATSAGPAKPFDRCLPVDRDAAAVVRPGSPMVKAGEKLPVRVLGGKGSASLVLDGDGRRPWQSLWLADAAAGAAVPIPASARGEWSLSAVGMNLGKNRSVLGGKVLVLPAVLPRLSAKRAGDGRVSPGAQVTIEAVLDDGNGRPLAGSVGAVVFDKAGGTHPERLLALDTRRSLAASASVDEKDIDAFLGGDQAFEMERWAALASPASPGAAPAIDPEPGVKEEIDEAFRQIVQSLEGAVFEASGDPERLPDVRVRTAAGFNLNPEMLTLVTQAMSEAPVTPGGEPWMLADLMAIDPQVRFDTVARRVARLKLFKLLAAVREFLFEQKLGRDEPALRDPNALLRRMVRDEKLSTGDLLDPWGHGMSFVRRAGPRIPFISMVPGYRLLSAGPDGRFGTADDLGDPFQRVLASKTPYAQAVEEDRIVDARWDMRVGDETVEAWKQLLEELTGRSLGDNDNAVNVLGSLGGGGTGEGYGVGGIGVGGTGTRGIDPGPARWLAPVRTDAQGRVRILVPLGDAETTWQIVLVATPDDGLPATASVEMATSLPLSVRANAGAAWIVGDEVEVALRVRNRTAQPVSTTLGLAASGAAKLVDPKSAKQTASVPAQSATTVFVRVAGATAGSAMLEATVEGAGHSHRLRHEWQIKPAGEIFTAGSATWVEQAATLALPTPTAATPAQGAGRLVLERGIEPALAVALDSLDPGQMVGARAFADALEVFGRVRAWAIVRGGEQHALAVRSRELAQQAMEGQVRRQNSSGHEHGDPLLLRSKHWGAIANPPQDKQETTPQRHVCPSEKSPALAQALDWLALAAWSDRKAENACWAALRASALGQLAQEGDPVLLARAVLLFRDMPAQAQVASALAARLFAAVPVRPDGTLVLPDHLAGDRAARSLVLAAFLRTAEGWPADRRALAGKLWARLHTERDTRGGYGSAEATRHVVAALLLADSGPATEATLRYTELSGKGKVLAQGDLKLAAEGVRTLALSPATTSVRLESSLPGLLARAERPLFRSFHRPVDPSGSPLQVDLSMSKPPARDGLAPLQVTLRHEVGRQVPVRVRIPLPPGAALAEPSSEMRQVQGAIYLRTRLDSDALPRVIEVPLRFALAGRVTMPEVTARITDDDIAPARAPARPLVIGDRPPAP